MRILYVASDQTVPGTVGGSIHVLAVADGLAARGHDVHVVATPGGVWPIGRVQWHALPPPFGQRHLRWSRAGTIARLARETRADVVIERYHNFGGEGVTAAHRLDLPAVLEVNAPIVDHAGSAKARLDRALLVEPMRRWRDRLCRMTSLFVTPSATILPAWVDPARVLEIEWGADTDRFHPGARGPVPFDRPIGRVLGVFAGAFRAWHGAIHFAQMLARRHREADARAGGLFVGDGPEHAAVARVLTGVPGVVITGSVSHDAMPAVLAAADIGVAPFDPARHPSLQLGFYWSPLKVFEYMAAGLPVVAPALPRLQRIVLSGREGLLYDPDDPRGLDRAFDALADPDLRRAMGAAARARVVRDFSWTTHVAALDARLGRLVPP